MNIYCSNTTTTKALSALFRSLQTPYSDSALSEHKIGNKVCMPDPDHFDYHAGGPLAFAKDYLAYNLARKGEFSLCNDQSYDVEKLKQEAVCGYLAVEREMAQINSSLDITISSPSINKMAPGAVINTARRKIEKLLKTFDLDEFIDHTIFSAGSSTRLPRSQGNPVFKFRGKPHVTRNCKMLAVAAMWHSPLWRAHCQKQYGRDSDPETWVTIQEFGEYFCVPKTFLSLRGAEKQPCLNLFLQKGLGNLIRKRLKAVRIDLNDQTYNQYLARCGSLTGALATIDLAAASDSISLRLVELLLPPDWFRFILMTRTDAVKLPDGSIHNVEKVSSMGNGFTFELESLIFWALTSAVVDISGIEDKRIGVFGDDIVVHHSAAPAVIDILNTCGFKTNVEKTWVEGPFRESCGKHYWYGSDVSPFNVSTPLENNAEVYHLINRYRLWELRVGIETPNEKITRYLTKFINGRTVLLTPPHLGTKAGFIPYSSEGIPIITSETEKPPRWQKPFVGIWLGKGKTFAEHRAEKARHNRYWSKFRLSEQTPQAGSWKGTALVEVIAQKSDYSDTAYLAWTNKSLVLNAPAGEIMIISDHKKEKVFKAKSFVTSIWSDLSSLL